MGLRHSPRPRSVKPGYLANGVGQRGARALDLRRPGTGRLQLGGVGAPRDRVRSTRRPVPRQLEGLTGLAEGVRANLEAFEELRAEADEYRELDGDRVLVLSHYRGRGKASGLELGQMRAQPQTCSTSAAAP